MVSIREGLETLTTRSLINHQKTWGHNHPTDWEGQRDSQRGMPVRELLHNVVSQGQNKQATEKGGA